MPQVQYWNGSQWMVVADSKSYESTTSNIKMNGTQSIGSSDTVARGDHVHPSDTTKANKSTIVNATLASASWTGASAPYSYSLTVTGVTATSNQELIPTTDVTDAQIKALQAANITDAGQSTNTILLKAWGTKPTIDLPIRVLLRGDM